MVGVGTELFASVLGSDGFGMVAGEEGTADRADAAPLPS